MCEGGGSGANSACVSRRVIEQESATRGGVIV